MKKIAVFLGGLLMLPAFAEVAPVFYDETLEYSDIDYDDAEYGVEEEEALPEKPEIINVGAAGKIARQPVAGRVVASRTTPVRTVPAATTNTSGRGTSSAAAGRAVASRATATPRTATSTTTARSVAVRGNATTAAATRATGGVTRGTVVTGRATTAATTRATGGATRAATTKTARATTARATSARAATLGVNGLVNTNNVLQTSNEPLYNSTARVSVRNDVGTAVRRTPTIRAASTGISTATESISVGTEDLEEMQDLTELTDYCKAQYAACMDNYCNVLDDNQGRCSCSSNITKYAKAEEALKQATEELQEVAQQIQYIGLSSREVETLFTQTEAELAMQSKTDTSQLKTSLDKVRDMIINVQSGGATSSTTSGLGFDLTGLLDFTIDSTGFDLGSLFGTNVSSVSNQRGAELFKTATNRCKTNVLKACKAQGVDESLITNAYDLEIDRECVAYERSLADSNDQMTATVRNAKSVLQRARLVVERSKNEYENMRECISELDNCMQDEYVCGSEYEKCLDPTGRYIVDGEIVVGSQPGHAIDISTSEVVSSRMTSDVCKTNLYRTWDFPGKNCEVMGVYDGANSTGTAWYGGPESNQNNAWGHGPNDNLAKYIEDTVSLANTKTSSTNMSQYLQNKIGYVENGRNYGMCISVLNKCQNYTYTSRGTYNAQNEVVKQYLQRAMVQIKAKQDSILAEYAESCITDVKTCLSKNGYPDDEPVVYDEDTQESESNWTSAQRTQANIAVNACRPTIITCMSVNGYSIDNPTPAEMNCWVMGLQYNTVTQECEDLVGYNGEEQPARHTLTMNCGEHATAVGGTWRISVSHGANATLGDVSAISQHCTQDSGYQAGVWNCSINGGNSSAGRPTQVILGGSYEMTDNATCTVQWEQVGSNHDENPDNPDPSTY